MVRIKRTFLNPPPGLPVVHYAMAVDEEGAVTRWTNEVAEAVLFPSEVAGMVRERHAGMEQMRWAFEEVPQVAPVPQQVQSEPNKSGRAKGRQATEES
jgi:hypothetical protein